MNDTSKNRNVVEAEKLISTFEENVKALSDDATKLDMIKQLRADAIEALELDNASIIEEEETIASVISEDAENQINNIIKEVEDSIAKLEADKENNIKENEKFISEIAGMEAEKNRNQEEFDKGTSYLDKATQETILNSLSSKIDYNKKLAEGNELANNKIDEKIEALKNEKDARIAEIRSSSVEEIEEIKRIADDKVAINNQAIEDQITNEIKVQNEKIKNGKELIENIEKADKIAAEKLNQLGSEKITVPTEKIEDYTSPVLNGAFKLAKDTPIIEPEPIAEPEPTIEPSVTEEDLAKMIKGDLSSLATGAKLSDGSQEPVVEPTDEEIAHLKAYYDSIENLKEVEPTDFYETEELEVRKQYSKFLDNYLSIDYDNLSQEEKENYRYALIANGISVTDKRFMGAEGFKEIDDLVKGLTDENALKAPENREFYEKWHNENKEKINVLEKEPKKEEPEKEKKASIAVAIFVVMAHKPPRQKVLDMAKDPAYIEEFKNWKEDTKAKLKEDAKTALAGLAIIGTVVGIGLLTKNKDVSYIGDSLGNIAQDIDLIDIPEEIENITVPEEVTPTPVTPVTPTPGPENIDPTPVPEGDTVTLEPGQTLEYPDGTSINNPADYDTPIEAPAPEERAPEEAAAIEQTSDELGSELDALLDAAGEAKNNDETEVSHGMGM